MTGSPIRGDALRTASLARAVTYGLCGLLLLVGAAQQEFWPLTSFRLFSQVRGPELVSWQLVTVDRAGKEHPVQLAGPDVVGLPRHVFPALVDATEAERSRIVWEYVDASAGPSDAVAARVYRVVLRASTRSDVNAEVVDRELAFAVDRL